jgi:hypothetical protein
MGAVADDHSERLGRLSPDQGHEAHRPMHSASEVARGTPSARRPPEQRPVDQLYGGGAAGFFVSWLSTHVCLGNQNLTRRRSGVSAEGSENNRYKIQMFQEDVTTLVVFPSRNRVRNPYAPPTS